MIPLDFLFLLAVLIAFFHMLAPDHWIPLTSLSAKRGYSTPKKYGIATLIGGGHATISGALGLLFLFLGFTFLKNDVNELIYISIALLLIVGLYFIINGYGESKETNRNVENSIIAVSVFPDFAIIPIMVSASEYTLPYGFLIFIGFLISSILSINAIIYLNSKTIGKRMSEMKPENLDYVIGFLLLATALILLAFPSF
ncbi:MAG: hypothetical protein M1581_01695 [Candidatus Thermoplasmatota archaeon]|nr:hypothetical protein [Candidatus Thermoplasmatota archaeon]